jgi:hypothetical protein
MKDELRVAMAKFKRIKGSCSNTGPLDILM